MIEIAYCPLLTVDICHYTSLIVENEIPLDVLRESDRDHSYVP